MGRVEIYTGYVEGEVTIKTPKDLWKPQGDRTKKYNIVATANIERARELHEMGHTSIADSITAQIDGGKCIRCGVRYREVAVDNVFAKYTYYMPDCDCFPVCWHCGKVLIEEKLNRENVKYCPNCGQNIWETKPYSLPTAKSVEQENLLGRAKEIQRHKDYRGDDGNS